MKSHKTDVVVVGAGPVGLTTALFLNEAGVGVTVVDAKSSGVTHSYALALHPASLELLDQLGVAETLVAQAVKVSRMSIYSGGRRIVSLPTAGEEARFPFVAVVGQDVIEATLAEALARRGVDVRWNTRLSRFTPEDARVEVGLDELETGVIGYAAARFEWLVRKSPELEARFIVGADGHQSLVRRQSLIDFPEVAPAEHCAVYEFESAGDTGREVSLVLHEDGLAVFWPLPGNRGRWSFSVDPARHPEAIREKNHDPVQILGPGVYPALEETFFHQLLEDRAPQCRMNIERVYWRMLVRFERRLASSFGSGRVWLAGDAAHLTGPAGVQSMNVGLREGRDLASAIGMRVTAGAGANALEAYDRDRREEWRRLLGLEGRMETASEADRAIMEHGSQLIPCLPASGSELSALAARIGLRVAA